MQRCLIGLVVLAISVACGPASEAPDAALDGGGMCRSDPDCDDGLFCTGTETCAPDAGADARGCVSSPPPCASGETCDESRDLCAADCVDADRDGALASSCGGQDCDDADPLRYPSALEVCDPDDVDEDCDPETFGARDLDDDGQDDAACCNGTVCGGDCDDTRAAVYTGASDFCDVRDNDCDGAIDEDPDEMYWPDLDEDGFGDPAGPPIRACARPPLHADSSTDCNDARASANPAAPELCNLLDDDCDVTVDEDSMRTFYRDADGDGWGVAAPTMIGCTAPTGYVAMVGDCDDGRAASNPAAPDICNGLNDDCAGLPDEGCDCVDGASLGCSNDEFGADALFGVCAPGVRTCVAGRWSMCTITPSAEACDFRDEDCDGSTDEGFRPYVICYADADDDGYPASDATSGVQRCRDTSRATVGGCPELFTNRPPVVGNVDCAPANDAVHPGASAYHVEPACPDPVLQLPCSSGGIWYCVPRATPVCTTTAPRATFDYDCNAVIAPEPAQTCASDGASCGSCGASGFDYVAAPACGTPQSYVTCGDCAGGSCGAISSASRQIGCR